MDSGCGSGIAIDELLSDNELKSYLHHVSGISMHYFKDIESVLNKHGSRFTYYSGTVQDVLSNAIETTNAFDLITDLFGAYTYSSDKINLLKQYHQALKPGGIARIFQQDASDLYLDIKGSKTNFIEWAASRYPETLSLKYNDDTCNFTIVMHKSTLRWPIPQCTIISSKENSSGMNYIYPDELEEYRKQNTLKISEIVEKPNLDQAIQLRPLAFR